MLHRKVENGLACNLAPALFRLQVCATPVATEQDRRVFLNGISRPDGCGLYLEPAL